MNKNIVIFKGIQNGILIMLDNQVSFNDIEKSLLEKMKNAKSFFKDANISITFKGRDLSEDEEAILLNIISKESGLDISFVNNIENTSREDTQVSSLEENISNNTIIQNYISNNQNSLTHFHNGSLRNGQKIDFAGSVVVIGDVNPGGQVVAEGNVIILGKLKGIVHAGCKGDKNCFISALHMMPNQLIIGDCLAYFPNDIKRDIVPEYAYVEDNQIFVKQLIK
ncbi:septum site-determining protein MinC [[Clostridium] colinum]|uniref:septum site-determining protein MinC n=1 Tax=[Clostridium] colinum TaxID=36835 RepID=UPI00202506B4|nr:septum site-determining protein MinC [[Clostridium] colinum]